MTNTQVTLIQIDNYGPWTVTPEPRREVDIQSLQSQLYADLTQLFGSRDGYVFYTRFDNMVAVTNGVDMDTHARIQESIRNRYPVTISLSVAVGPTPAEALSEATAQLQAAGSAQDKSRREILRGDSLSDLARRDDDIQIAHFDVNDATEKYTDEINAFDSFVQIERGYVTLMEYLRQTHDSLSFFVGGDNIIAVCTALDSGDYERTIEHVNEVVELPLKVGVGRGRTAADAGMDAKHALEVCRTNGTRIEGELPVTQGD